MEDKEGPDKSELDEPATGQAPKKNIKDIMLTRRNLIKLGIGIGVFVGIGYYSTTLLSQKPKKHGTTPRKPTSTEQGGQPTETAEQPTETSSVPAYYQIYLENGEAKGLNVQKNSIDFQNSDHHYVIQNCLNALPSRDSKLKVSLKGDFSCIDTIKIPPYTIFEVDGNITLANNANKILVQESNTLIGTQQIEMIGGTYDGNKNNQTITNNVVDFTKVSNSHFANLIIQNSGKDCFVLDTECNNNLIENVTGRLAGLGNVSDGNGLDDRGDNNTWKNCVAEDNFSDNWVIKCRKSTFINCIGRGSVGAVGFGFYGDRDITDNQFVACEAYNNKTNGISMNIPEKANGHAIRIMNNSIQGSFHDNQDVGVRLTDVTIDGMLENNTFDILVYNNGKDGFSLQQDRVNNNSGSIVAYDNAAHDASIKGSPNTFSVYQPQGSNGQVIAAPGNTINKAEISCGSSKSWAVNKYCSA